jgi:hypothetical protein
MSEPYYKSEKCFRRYEKFIEQALLVFPNPVLFSTGLAATTDVARCNDAIKSYCRNKWPVNEESLFATIETRKLRAIYSVEHDSPLIQTAPDSRSSPKSANQTTLSTVPAHMASNIPACEDAFGAVAVFPQSDLHLEQLVNLIDSSVLTFPCMIPDQWQAQLDTLISDRLNIAYRHNAPHLILF